MSKYDNEQLPSDSDSTSSIASWLQGHPIDPTDYEGVHWGDLERKLLDAVEQSSTLSNKRPRLREITANAMSEQEKPKRPPPSQQTSKRKREQSLTEDTSPMIPDHMATSVPPSTPNQDQYASVSMSPDEDKTPKPAIRRALFEVAHSGFTASGRQSKASSASSTSIGSKSGSPTKSIADFQLTDVQVEMKDFETEGYPVPDTALRLYEDICRIGAGLGVLPRVFRDQLDKLDKAKLIRESNFEDIKRSIYDLDGELDECKKSALFWHKILDINTAAKECRNEGLSEPEWNGEVHSSVLRLALKSSRASSNVWYRNVTTDHIRDASLLPTRSGSGTQRESKMQKKMIDFVMMLEPDPDLKADIRHFLNEAYPSNSRPSINHIEPQYLRFSPIAVGIETKRAAIDEDNAHVQLSLWVTAHFAKLRQVIALSTHQASRPCPLPILPLVVIQGHNWKFLIASCNPNPQATNTLSNPKTSITIFQEISIGTTANPYGCLIILAALKRLGTWVGTDFKEWWNTCLGNQGRQT